MPGLGTKEGTAFRQDLLINRPVAEPSLEGFFFFALDDNSGTLYQCDGEDWVPITGGLRRLVSGSGITLVNTPTTITINNAYSLPIATFSILGGIKVGSGLAIDSGGVLSATTLTLPSDIAYTDAANIFTVHQQIDTHVAGITGDLTLSILDHTTSASIYVTALGTGNFLEYHSPASVFIVDNSSNIYMGGTFKQINNTALLDGQLLIGNTAGGRMDVATLTAGTGITITNGPGSITIDSTGGGGGGGTIFEDWKKLDEVVVGVGGLANIRFSSIPATAKHLKIVYTGRSSGSSNALEMRFNGDTGANYKYYASYTSVSAPANGVINGGFNGSTFLFIGWVSDSSVANSAGGGEILIPNYRGTIFNKQASSRSGFQTTADYAATAMNDGFWASTAAITQIDLFIGSGTLVEGSTFTLYGLTDMVGTVGGGGAASEAINHNGTLVATRPTLNLIDGSNVTLTVADNSGTNSVDVTVASTGGGGGGGATYDSLVLADTPIAYYKLDESVGATTILDSGGSSYSGTVSGGVTFGNSGGILGTTCAHFNGSTGTISVSGLTGHVPLGHAAYSIELWAKFDVSSTAGLVAWGDQTVTNGACGVLTLGSGTIDNSTNNVDFSTGAVAMGLGHWHHLVVTYDGTTSGSGNAVWYIDGVLRATHDNWNPNILAGVFKFGTWAGGNLYQGYMSHVAIYDHALTANRIMTHFVAPS